MMKMILKTAVIATACGLMTACTEKEPERHGLCGTIDEPMQELPAPDKVIEAIGKYPGDRQVEILRDTANEVTVHSLVRCSIDEYSDGYGIVIAKGRKVSKMPDIIHGKNPIARYDADKNVLWLTGGATEGTGVLTERLYKITFDEDGTAHKAYSIDPYAIQQSLLEKLKYSTDGHNFSFYDKDRFLCTTTITETDMGGADNEHPLWIGEQICYDISGDDIYVVVTPGLKFNTGLVLNYENMPMLSARIEENGDGAFSTEEIERILRPFEGEYLEKDSKEPCLNISYRRNDGKYDVNLSIIRLTNLEGIATMEDNGLELTATDAAGNPIRILLSLIGNEIEATVIDSKWPLLENGTSFRYLRH